ncbi:MAG: tetratricopeptide repeat protein [Prevotella sp.]
MKYLPLYIFVILAMMSCDRSNSTQLAVVDSLLYAQNPEEAEHRWQKIDTAKLNQEEKMHYRLLGEEIRSGQHQTSLQTENAHEIVEYYSQSGNDEMLTRAYLQLAIRQQAVDSAEAAINSLKQAEQLANKNKNVRMSSEVMYNLSKVNAMSGNFNMAMKYAKSLYQGALRRRDSSDIAMSCNMLACIFDMENNTDSAFSYMKKLERYVDHGTPTFRAFYLANLGILYMRQHQDSLARTFLKRSINITPIADAYSSLAVIYAREGNMEQADSLWRIALNTDKLYYKITFLQTMFTQYYSIGKYKEACDISSQLIPLKDTLTMKQQTARIQELQQKYDQQIIRHKMIRNLYIAVFVIFLLVVIGICYVLYTRNKQQKASEIISNSQSLIDNYTRQIKDLQHNGQTAEQKVEELKNRINVLQKKQTGILANGRELYDEIVNGGKTLLWKKEDFTNFIEYYKVVNLQFVQSLETEYDNLSSTHKFFMILSDMGKTDEEIQQIMGLSYGAFRTTKYRIKKKALDK